MNISAIELIDEHLRAARGHIESASPGDAMRFARAAEKIAADSQYEPGQAEARLCIADIQLRLTGEFRPALESARKAALGFQVAGLVSGECKALALQAIAAARLAYFETAVDAALLAVLLSRNSALDTSPQDEVVAYQSLGIAMFAGRAYDEAANAMRRALERAQQVCSLVELHELHADLASTEVIRYFTSREAGEHLHELETLENHLAKCHSLTKEVGFQEPPRHKNSHLIYQLSRANFFTWQGRPADAQHQIDEIQSAIQTPPRPWMEASLNWCRAELALSQSELSDARMHCDRMVAIAMIYQHGTLLNLGLRLKAHLAGMAGDHATAAQALSTLSAREQKARSEGLRFRISAVERQMELRQRTEELRTAKEDSQRFHDLANQDALTKLPNRRYFESFMEKLLQDCRLNGGTHCLVYVDVDQFKAINDQYSHGVGDLVLQGIGQTLRSSAREHDLPVRIAGDEFAVVLRNMDLQLAQAFCRRLRIAVANHPWDTVAAGLCVTVSLGVAEMITTDSLADLLARSDLAMYADKSLQRTA